MNIEPLPPYSLFYSLMENLIPISYLYQDLLSDNYRLFLRFTGLVSTYKKRRSLYSRTRRTKMKKTMALIGIKYFYSKQTTCPQSK